MHFPATQHEEQNTETHEHPMGSTDQASETSEHIFAPILQQSTALDTDLFCCHWNQAEDIGEPLGYQHVLETIFDVSDTEPNHRHHVRIDFQHREAFAREETHVRTWLEPQIALSGINDESLLQAVIFADRKKVDPFFGFQSLSQQTNQFEICASAVRQPDQNTTQGLATSP